MEGCQEMSLHQPSGSSINQWAWQQGAGSDSVYTRAECTCPSTKMWDTRSTSYPNPAGQPCTPKEALQYRSILYNKLLSLWCILKVTVGKTLLNFPQSETVIPSVIVYAACCWQGKSMLLCLKIDGIALHILALANVCGTTFTEVVTKRQVMARLE